MIKFTIRDFNKLYPNDDACLQAVFSARYLGEAFCPSCKNEARFHRVKGRKCYACQWCGFQLHPLADTIFHKSSTSLHDWFYAIFLFANSKNGVSAKELERQLGVTYKTAWRMAREIRRLMQEDADGNGPLLGGTVEADETYIGGKHYEHEKGTQFTNKVPVVGIVERKGRVVAKVTGDTRRATVMPIVHRNVAMGSQLITDDSRIYLRSNRWGYTHNVINHTKKRYVRGDIHTNSIEGFWSQLKRSLSGTHHAVSPKFLQSYVNEFVWKYNRRESSVSLFSLALAEAVMPLR